MTGTSSRSPHLQVGVVHGHKLEQGCSGYPFIVRRLSVLGLVVYLVNYLLMYAVLRSGGKQEIVRVGDRVIVERLQAAPGSIVRLAAAAVVDGATVLATPEELQDVVVEAAVTKEVKGPKITGFTYKPKTNNRRRFGHRQHYSEIRIKAINVPNMSGKEVVADVQD